MTEPTYREAPAGGLPRIALAMGDPAGIGPEILAKALADPRVHQVCLPVVIGDARVMARAVEQANLESRIIPVSDPEQAKPGTDALCLVDMDNVPEGLPMAQVSVEGGRASLEYLERATRLALDGKVEAVVFAPLNKEAMKKAGSHHLDEYSYFAELCGAEEYSVFMVSPRFSLASVTLHVPFREVADQLTVERVLSTIRYSQRAALAAGIEKPRIGVAALNPHAGEHGTLGTEEQDVIIPAVEAARAEGMDVEGPFPADTFFMTVAEPRYHVYVGMYHDQGRIALKLMEFGKATTLAEGLPVIYCTVGHGTAYDIAGKGIANHQNMVDTILLTARRALARRSEAR